MASTGRWWGRGPDIMSEDMQQRAQELSDRAAMERERMMQSQIRAMESMRLDAMMRDKSDAIRAEPLRGRPGDIIWTDERISGDTVPNTPEVPDKMPADLIDAMEILEAVIRDDPDAIATAMAWQEKVYAKYERPEEMDWEYHAHNDDYVNRVSGRTMSSHDYAIYRGRNETP